MYVHVYAYSYDIRIVCYPTSSLSMCSSVCVSCTCCLLFCIQSSSSRAWLNCLFGLSTASVCCICSQCNFIFKSAKRTRTRRPFCCWLCMLPACFSILFCSRKGLFNSVHDVYVLDINFDLIKV